MGTRSFLHSMNNFRAFTILMIIIGHCFPLSGAAPSKDNTTVLFFFNLFSGGTGIFVFISGYMFQHVFIRNFSYRKFLAKKMKNVLFPYLLLSIIPIIYYTFIKPNYSQYGIDSKIIAIPFYLLTGKHFLAYWYIPFAMVLFFLSPIFIKFNHQNPKTKVYLTLLLFANSIVLLRPIENLNLLQSILYFTPFYLMGMLFSEYSRWVSDFLKGKELFLILIVLIVTFLQTNYSSVLGNYHGSPYCGAYPDLQLIQKVFLIALMYSLLHRFLNYEIKILHNIATYSFTSYFLHSYMLWCIGVVSDKLQISLPTTPLNPIVLGLLITFATTTIGFLIKKIIPQYSRMIIGT